MALTYGFYNSINHDRAYDATQISKVFDGIIMDGVFQSIGNRMMVSPVANMNVKIGSGRAWFNHTWNYNDADTIVTIEQADGVFPRTDIIYLQISTADEVRTNSFEVLKGTPGVNADIPPLLNTATVFKYPLAYIRVGAGVSEILAQDITNKVGTALCPFVTGPLATINTSDLLVQWEAQFLAWFAGVQGILNQEVAGNLLNLIRSHNHSEPENQLITPAGIQNQIRQAMCGPMMRWPDYAVPDQQSNFSYMGVTLDLSAGQYIAAYIKIPEDAVPGSVKAVAFVGAGYPGTIISSFSAYEQSYDAQGHGYYTVFRPVSVEGDDPIREIKVLIPEILPGDHVGIQYMLDSYEGGHGIGVSALGIEYESTM